MTQQKENHKVNKKSNKQNRRCETLFHRKHYPKTQQVAIGAARP